MKTHILLFPLLALLLVFSASVSYAGSITYLQDPIYKPMNADDPPPMTDMLALAGEGDARAQFIVANLYEKGEGGLPQDLKIAHDWFEKSALNGNAFSFIRLAALAKLEKKPVSAYKWYTLAIARLSIGPDRTWALTARSALDKTAHLTAAQENKAKKSAAAWDDTSYAARSKLDVAQKKKVAEDAAAQKIQDAKEGLLHAKTGEKTHGKD